MAPRLDRALSYISEARSIGGFGENFIAGLSGLVLFVFTAIMGVGEAVANLFIQPTDATAGGISAMIRANLEGPARFIQSMWNTAAVQMGLDPWNTLGPFIVIVGAIAVVGFLFVIYEFYDYMDWDAPGWDVPWLQADEGRDLDDEV
jgi:hypothetical protein